MLSKLRTRLILLTMGGAIFAIVLVSLITNFTIFNQFGEYRVTEQEQKIEEVLDMIQEAYLSENYWSDRVLQYIVLSPLIKDFDIVIRDSNQNIILESYIDTTMRDHHDRMMRNMRHGMMMGGSNRQNMDQLSQDENYVRESYDLNMKGEKISTVDIGYVGPFTVSDRDLSFIKEIKNSILYASFISIIVSAFLGLFSSRIFVRPILKITDAANSIRKGELNTKIDEESNIIELNDLSKSINHLSQSLAEQELLRKRLTSDISHELRTPLTVLQSHIEAISDGIWEPTQDRLDICKNEVTRLIKLVGEINYLTDIEKHKIKIYNENYNLSDDIVEVIEGFKHQFSEKGITLNSDIDKDIYIIADGDKIRQVIINLLSNALKFTNKGGNVKVDLKDIGERVKIAVEDTGIGVEEKDIPYLFERLYRSDISRNRKTGGTGIGLAISKTLIEKHGGTIEVESKRNKGTKLIIILPKEGELV